MATWTQWWKGIKGDFLGFVDDSNGDADVLCEKVLQDYMRTITFVHSSSERGVSELIMLGRLYVNLSLYIQR